MRILLLGLLALQIGCVSDTYCRLDVTAPASLKAARRTPLPVTVGVNRSWAPRVRQEGIFRSVQPLPSAGQAQPENGPPPGVELRLELRDLVVAEGVDYLVRLPLFCYQLAFLLPNLVTGGAVLPWYNYRRWAVRCQVRDRRGALLAEYQQSYMIHHAVGWTGYLFVPHGFMGHPGRHLETGEWREAQAQALQACLGRLIDDCRSGALRP